MRCQPYLAPLLFAPPLHLTPVPSAPQPLASHTQPSLPPTPLQVHVSLPGTDGPVRRTIRALSPSPPHATPLPGAGGAGAGGAAGSVGAHFEAALGRKLMHPGMLCVDVAESVGGAPEWVPAELCRCVCVLHPCPLVALMH